MKANALVARNVRRIRVAQGVSQEALAFDAGLDRTYISGIERGLENPTVAVLEQLARALGARVTDLFAPPRSGEPAPRPLQGGRRSGRKVS
jgi:transcriptional regulator with XRE-family HTH domain